MKKQIRHWLFGVQVVLLLLVGLPVFAAEKLQADLLQLVTRARNDAPIPVEVTLRWSGTRLLEGRMELEFLSGNQPLGRYRSVELALTAGAQRFRWLLPSLQSGYDQQVEVRMRFLTGRESLDLGNSILFIPTVNERVFVIAVCDPLGAGSPAATAMVQSLKVEQLFTVPDSVSQRALQTIAARLAPEDMPVQPLAYCAYDMVVVMADALGQLRERQLEALRRWVRGGGSVCVLMTGSELKPQHERWLRSLADADEPLPERALVKFHTGLGRSVVSRHADSTSLSDWREAVAFLWKARASQAEQLRNGKVTLPTYQLQRYTQEYKSTGFRRPPGINYNPGMNFSQLLLPQTMRLIPFRSLAWMFGLFVLAIGPLDYWVLGWLKRRRYTWVLFPVVTVAFTVVTVQMANHYLGRRDQRRAVVFVDVGPGNTVLRQDRYELVFTGRDREVKTEWKGALWSQLSRPGQSPMPMPYGYRGQIVDDGAERVGVIEGQFPTAFTAKQSVRQWQPQMHRVLAVDVTGESVMGNWDAISFEMVSRLRPHSELMQRIFGRAADDVDLYVLNRGAVVYRGFGRGFPFFEQHVTGTSIPPEDGLFAGLARLSPSGGGTYDELPVLDGSDPQEWLVVAVTQRGDDYVVYRRIYR